MGEAFKRQAAEAAMDEIAPGMRIGLGTGSTANQFVDLLGARVAQGFDCICVPTSEATAVRARDLGIPLSTLDALERLDLTVDGTDEIDAERRLIKGGGGALLREKIVAAASDRMIVIADHTKRVATLGQFALPIEVNLFGQGATANALRTLMTGFGAQGDLVLRRNEQGQPFVTDGGHGIFDASFGRILDPEALAGALHAIPGVVEHGLFLGLCTRAYLAGPEGVAVLEDRRAASAPHSLHRDPTWPE